VLRDALDRTPAPGTETLKTRPTPGSSALLMRDGSGPAGTWRHRLCIAASTKSTSARHGAVVRPPTLRVLAGRNASNGVSLPLALPGVLHDSGEGGNASETPPKRLGSDERGMLRLWHSGTVTRGSPSPSSASGGDSVLIICMRFELGLPSRRAKAVMHRPREMSAAEVTAMTPVLSLPCGSSGCRLCRCATAEASCKGEGG
jgi:hypothetical protein